MWYITKIVEIDAAHQIQGYPSKCSRLHGHRWRIEVTIKAEKLNEYGIGIDFHDIKKAIEELDLDHRFLNDFFSPTTAEVFAKYVFEKMKSKGLDVVKVTIWETPSSKVEYIE